MDLKQHIREIIEQELNELARISTLHKIGDAKKAAALKKLHAGTWIEDMINAVEKGGETGITRNDIVVATGKGHTAAVSPMIRKLLDAGVFVLGSLAKAKKEKTSSGIKGRPTSEKTLVAKKINQDFEADINYQPSQEEIDLLGDEFINKLKMRVQGTLKRGRPVGASKMKDIMKVDTSVEDTEDNNEDGVVDDEDLKLNESFTRMQKLAGVITEQQYKEKLTSEGIFSKTKFDKNKEKQKFNILLEILSKNFPKIVYIDKQSYSWNDSGKLYFDIKIRNKKAEDELTCINITYTPENEGNEVEVSGDDGYDMNKNEKTFKLSNIKGILNHMDEVSEEIGW